MPPEDVRWRATERVRRAKSTGLFRIISADPVGIKEAITQTEITRKHVRGFSFLIYHHFRNVEVIMERLSSQHPRWVEEEVVDIDLH